jgi:hypothetical protein
VGGQLAGFGPRLCLGSRDLTKDPGHEAFSVLGRKSECSMDATWVPQVKEIDLGLDNPLIDSTQR